MQTSFRNNDSFYNIITKKTFTNNLNQTNLNQIFIMKNNVENICNYRRGRAANDATSCRGRICCPNGSIAIPGVEFINNTLPSVASTILDQGADERYASWATDFDTAFDYTNYINTWYSGNSMVSEKTSYRQSVSRGRRVWEFERILYRAKGIMKSYAISTSVKEAKRACDYALVKRYGLLPQVQMDGEGSKESVQGIATQESDKAENTIVTRDSGATQSHAPAEHKATDYCSTEKVASFDAVTARWMPLKTIAVVTGNARETVIAQYYLPETLYEQMGSSPNLLPFETYIYGTYDIEMKFVVNANKFQSGKLIASVKFDSYQAETVNASVNAALTRKHVIIDLASNTEAQIEIPFRYHRALLRNVRHDNATVGVRPSKYATVYLQVLSPLVTGTGGPNNVYMRPYIKLTRAEFAGMSYRVQVQMDTVTEMLKTATPFGEVRAVLDSAERLLKTIGSTANRDKPSVIGAVSVVPRPRLNFGTGKGTIDTLPLRNNPYAMTSYGIVKPCPDEPKTTLEIAQIWGLRTATNWSASQSVGTTILDMVIDPSVREYDKGYDGVPTPLEYVTSMYKFWSGTMEVRLDFVSTAFHTGSVMISAEFGRPPAVSVEKDYEAASTYTKIFDLGEQRSVSFVIPYIYDTVWRRTNTTTFDTAYAKGETNDDKKSRMIDIRADSRARLRVRVVNTLRPVETVAQSIEVLVFWRATPSYSLHSLKSSSMFVNHLKDKLPYMDNFPLDGYRPQEYFRDNRGAMKPVVYDTAVKSKMDAKRAHNVAGRWNERVARIQMDQGEKEDEDTTANFSIGPFGLGLQTTDSQVSIKDILRRPTMLLHHMTVNGYGGGETQGFYIPLMPPSRMMSFHPEHEDLIWSHLAAQTPTAMLMNLFRFWRGSMRYTIVVTADVPEPVYVTHIPHSGTRCLGNRLIGEKDHVSWRPVAGSGLTTEMIIARVNPSAVIEVPYDTENDWTLTFDEDPERNYAWRDKADGNAGHLLISCHRTVSVDVWWSAGDDFEVANFYGMPACVQENYTTFNDVHGRVQADDGQDFRRADSSYLRRAIGVMKQVAVPMGLSMIPQVGPALAMSHTLSKVGTTLDGVDSLADQVRVAVATADEVVTTTADEIKNTMRRTNEVAGACAQLVGSVHEQVVSLTNTILDGLRVIPTVRTIVEHSIFDIIAAWMSKSWSVVGCGVVRILYQVVGGVGGMLDYGLQLAEVLRRMAEGVARTQADDDHTLVGLLCALVGSIVGVTLAADGYSRWQTRLARVFTTSQGVSYLNQVMRFMKNTFGCIRDLVMDALGLVDPQVAAIKSLCSNSALLNDFVMNAQLCMNEANVSMLSVPAFRLKFWTTTIRAYQIQKAMVTAGSNIATPHLAKMCADVIKMATERFVDLSCSPVRYEPFVICLTGATKIGKSYMTNKMVKELLNHIGFSRTTSGISYTRAVGSKFWSSYRDQPVIIYDDWLNLSGSESVEQQISELYQLKTTTRFIPEMAHIEEKRISANPMIVVLVCNEAFPDHVANVARHTDAVFRRRDIVIEARLKPEFVGKELRDELTAEQSEGLDHLEFTMWKDPRNINTKCRNYRGYQDTMEYLKGTYHRYHAQETLNVRRRIDEFGSYLHLAPGDVLGDPFELMYGAQHAASLISQNAWLPSEQLELAVHELVSIVERDIRVPDIQVPVAPSNPFVQADYGQIAWSGLKMVVEGLLMTPVVWSRIVTCTYDAIASMMPTAEFDTHAIGRCSVCMEDNMALVATCTNSTVDSIHAVCRECLPRMRSALSGDQADRCPVCRAGDLEVTFSEPATAWLKIIMWIAEKGREYIKPIVTCLSGLGEVMPHRIIMSLRLMIGTLYTLLDPLTHGRAYGSTAVSLATDMYLRPEVSFAGEMSVFPHVALSTAFVEGANATVAGIMLVQADEGEDWPEIPEVQDTPTDFFDLTTIREDLLPTYQVTSEVVCFHQKVLDQRLSVLYCKNPTTGVLCWKVILPSHLPDTPPFDVYVPDGVCCAECPFANEITLRHFYHEYSRQRRHNLRIAAIAVYNRVGGASDRARDQIPRLLRPLWMEPVPVIHFSESWWEYLSGVYEKYKVIIQVCTAVVAVAGGVVATMHVWNSLGSPAPQADLNYNVGDARQLRRIAVQRNVRPRRIATQADTLSEVVMDQIVRNYVVIKIWEDGEVKRQMVLLGICGKYAIMPKHYIRMFQAQADKEMTIEPALYLNGKKSHMMGAFTFDYTTVREMLDTDLASIRLPNSYPSFKDIRKFFQTEQDLASYYQNEGMIVLVPTRKRQHIVLKDIDIYNISDRVKFEDASGDSFMVSSVLEYSHSEAGVCGSAVMVRESQRPIRAMHAAGNDANIGYGILVTQELLKELAPDQIRLQYEDTDFESLIDRPEVSVFDLDTRVDYLGAVPKDKIPHTPKKTKIVPSRIQRDMDPPVTEPAILHAGDPRYEHPRSPLWYGTRKHGQCTKDFQSGQIHQAREAMWDRIIGPMKPIVLKPKRLSPEEAIVGKTGIEFYDPMRLDTSAGYPWQLMRDDTTKRAWCKVDRNEHGEVTECALDPELLQELARKEELRRSGVIPCTMFTDTLKDERKSRVKVRRPGATRVFCASPMDYTIATRQNLLHFCAAFMKKRLGAMHAVGINAKGPEWTQLFQKLTQVSPLNIVNMDYSNFGPAFNAAVAEAATDLMVRWTMREVENVNETELRALLSECTNSVHIAGPLVYRQFAGSPSGAAITTIINTLVNQLYLLIAWRELAGERAIGIHPDIYHVFCHKVSLVAYGDDFIMAVADEFKDVFNTNTIRDFFAKYGIAATSADKELVDIPDFVPISRASFLKRTFRPHDTRTGMILGPLELASLEDIPKWIWRCADEKLATRVNVESSLLEAHAHGREYFEGFKERLNGTLRKHRIDSVSLQWNDLDDQWFEGRMPLVDPIL